MMAAPFLCAEGRGEISPTTSERPSRDEQERFLLRLD